MTSLCVNCNLIWYSFVKMKARNVLYYSCYWLQVLDPDKRLGCDEAGGFEILKAHEFFKNIDWDHLHKLKPPALVPYLPATSSNPEQCWSTMKVCTVDA